MGALCTFLNVEVKVWVRVCFKVKIFVRVRFGSRLNKKKVAILLLLKLGLGLSQWPGQRLEWQNCVNKLRAILDR